MNKVGIQPHPTRKNADLLLTRIHIPVTVGSNPSISLVKDEEVRKQHLIRVPPQVQDIIFPDQTSVEEYIYYWYIHTGEENEYVYISNNTPREENSTTIQSTEAHKDAKNRTSIPKEITQKKDISIGDSLYFCTHENVNETSNPSVAILTYDEFMKELDIGIQNREDNQLLRSFEHTTLEEENNADLGEILDDEL